MKLKYTYTILMVIFLQGCTKEFNEKYSISDNLKSEDSLLYGKDVKDVPFRKVNNSYLGEEVIYETLHKNELDKTVKLKTFDKVSIETVMETILTQLGISYKVNSGFKGIAEIKPEQFNVEFSGSLRDLLKYVSALYDVNISLDKNKIIEVTYYAPYTIKLDYFGGDQQTETGLDLSGNQSTSSGGVKGKTQQTFKSTFWADVETVAGKYISSGNYSILKDVSTLSFTGRPSEYENLKKMFDMYKVDNNKQFVLSYKIFTIDKKKIKKIEGGVGLKYLQGGTNIDINSKYLAAATDGVNITTGKTDGFNITGKLDALYELAGKKVLQSGTFITRNNIPVPVNMTRQQNYISGRTRTTSDNTSAVETQVTTGQVVTGSSFMLTPRIMSDGNIELITAFTKKTLNSIDSFDSVQLPDVSATEMFNNSVIKPGTLLVVAQYEGAEYQGGNGVAILGANYNSEDNDSTIVMIVGIDLYAAPTE